MTNRLMLISSDCHAGAPWFVYRKYLDPQYREDYGRWVATFLDGATALNQEQLDKEKPLQFDRVSPGRQLEYLEGMERAMGHLGNWDPDTRIRELNREGIAGEVIFCDGSQKNFPPFGVGILPRGEFGTNVLREQASRYAYRVAGCRAHNRWLAELCQSSPGRHAGVALVTTDEPEETVNEIHWAKDNGLSGGILLPALQLNADGPESFWHHARYEPIWRACEELEMPVNTHAGPSGPHYGGSPLISSFENTWVTFRPFWMLLWGGVLERHPRLRLCITESGGMQVLWFNAYFDQWVMRYRPPEWIRSAISLKPSDYWYRQCYIGCSAHSSRAEIDARYQLGVNNIMWGSDYPHPEGTWPASMERIKELFHSVPASEVRLMIGENAAAVYGFDRAFLETIAAQIGPTVEEVTGTVSAPARSESPASSTH